MNTQTCKVQGSVAIVASGRKGLQVGRRSSCETVKLVGCGHGLAAGAVHLPLPNHVHRLDSGDKNSSTPKRFESEHRLGDSFDSSVVLLNDVVEVFVLAHQDVNTGISLDAFNGGCIPGFNRFAQYMVGHSILRLEMLLKSGMLIAAFMSRAIEFISPSVWRRGR